MIPPDENAMQKEGEAVRKSNVIIIAILMVASIAFLWLWNYLGFHLIDMRDLLDNLNYDPNVSPDASQKRLRFSYIVHSPKFSDEGRVWEGDVVQVSGPRDSLPFNSAQELSKILSSQAV